MVSMMNPKFIRLTLDKQALIYIVAVIAVIGQHQFIILHNLQDSYQMKWAYKAKKSQ